MDNVWLFILWWLLGLTGIVWIVVWEIIFRQNPEQAETISEKIGIFFLHIKTFFRWLFNFNWIAEKIDSKSNKLSEDFIKKYPIITQYNPPDWLNSAEIWLLLYRRVRSKDLLSLIYKWKADGLINIEANNKSEIIITRLHMIPGHYKNYEEHLFDVLIPYPTTVLKKYLKRSPKFDKWLLEKYAIKRWWVIPSSSRLVNIIIISLFFIYIICLGAVSIITQSTYIIWYGFIWLLLLLSLLILVKSISMKWNKFKETEEWAKLISHILWYKEFLKSCDENKLMLSLKNDPSYFERTLSFATVLWLKNELINKISPTLKHMNTSIYNLENIKYSSPNARYCVLLWIILMSFWFLIIFSSYLFL